MALEVQQNESANTVINGVKVSGLTPDVLAHVAIDPSADLGKGVLMTVRGKSDVGAWSSIIDNKTDSIAFERQSDNGQISIFSRNKPEEGFVECNSITFYRDGTNFTNLRYEIAESTENTLLNGVKVTGLNKSVRDLIDGGLLKIEPAPNGELKLQYYFNGATFNKDTEAINLISDPSSGKLMVSCYDKPVGASQKVTTIEATAAGMNVVSEKTIAAPRSEALGSLIVPKR